VRLSATGAAVVLAGLGVVSFALVYAQACLWTAYRLFMVLSAGLLSLAFHHPVLFGIAATLLTAAWALCLRASARPKSGKWLSRR
jgi:hypothetical protein